jgi:hypothetical protein
MMEHKDTIYCVCQGEIGKNMKLSKKYVRVDNGPIKTAVIAGCYEKI